MMAPLHRPLAQKSSDPLYRFGGLHPMLRTDIPIEKLQCCPSHIWDKTLVPSRRRGLRLPGLQLHDRELGRPGDAYGASRLRWWWSVPRATRGSSSKKAASFTLCAVAGGALRRGAQLLREPLGEGRGQGKGKRDSRRWPRACVPRAVLRGGGARPGVPKNLLQRPGAQRTSWTRPSRRITRQRTITASTSVKFCGPGNRGLER